MKQVGLTAAALAFLVSYGIAEGLWTNRWHTSDALDRSVARLDAVPRLIGEWQGVDQKLDPRQVARAEMSGYLMRRYVHAKSGAVVNVLLVCGRPGPTSVHSPDICYAGAGYTPAGAPTRRGITAGKTGVPSFWVAQFQKPGPAPEPLRIYWAWGAEGEWLAADRPRIELAHHAVLYKLYVVRSLSSSDESLTNDPSDEFLQQFLPEVREALFAK